MIVHMRNDNQKMGIDIVNYRNRLGYVKRTHMRKRSWLSKRDTPAAVIGYFPARYIEGIAPA